MLSKDKRTRLWLHEIGEFISKDKDIPFDLWMKLKEIVDTPDEVLTQEQLLEINQQYLEVINRLLMHIEKISEVKIQHRVCERPVYGTSPVELMVHQVKIPGIILTFMEGMDKPVKIEEF